MDTTTIASATPECTVPELDTRAGRALKLYVEHAEAIARSFRAGVYKVPSCTGRAVYTVRFVPAAYCSCPDFRGGECKHVMAARVVRKTTAPCSECGARFRYRDLTEVTEDHESLTFFPGDRLCEGCLTRHGGIS